MAAKKQSKTHSKQANKSKPLETDADTNTAETGPVKPRHYRKAAREVIEKTYKTIVVKLASEATNGSVRHTKLLFDLGGVQAEAHAAHPRKRKSPSLGELLLKEAEAMKRNKQEQTNTSGKVE